MMFPELKQLYCLLFAFISIIKAGETEVNSTFKSPITNVNDPTTEENGINSISKQDEIRKTLSAIFEKISDQQLKSDMSKLISLCFDCMYENYNSSTQSLAKAMENLKNYITKIINEMPKLKENQTNSENETWGSSIAKNAYYYGNSFISYCKSFFVKTESTKEN